MRLLEHSGEPCLRPVSLDLDRPVEELQRLMQMLIEEWKRQAGEMMRRFGYEAGW